MFRKYRSGPDFEEAVLGRRSDINPVKEFRPRDKNFDHAIKTVIGKSKFPYPDTPIGRSLYFFLRRQLDEVNIKTRGLALLPCVGNVADIQHGVDCFFYLPSLNHVVTVDLFNLSPDYLSSLKDMWLDSFQGELFSEENLQNNLFYSKKGYFGWKREPKVYDPEENIPLDAKITFTDFRVFNDYPREENHFILTPYHTGSYRNRRGFASMIADYFIKVARDQKQLKKEAKSPICA